MMKEEKLFEQNFFYIRQNRRFFLQKQWRYQHFDIQYAKANRGMVFSKMVYLYENRERQGDQVRKFFVK